MCSRRRRSTAPRSTSMGYVEGVVLDWPPTRRLLPSPPSRVGAPAAISSTCLPTSTPSTWTRSGSVTWPAAYGYIERQLKRWSTQWANSKTCASCRRSTRSPTGLGDPRAAAAGVSSWPTATTGWATAWTDPSTGRIAAVLDWELCTLGDPLADIGYLGVYWTDPGVRARRPNDPPAAEASPRYAELLACDADRTGRDLSGNGLLRRLLVVAFGRHRPRACTPASCTARWATRAIGPADLATLPRPPPSNSPNPPSTPSSPL